MSLTRLLNCLWVNLSQMVPHTVTVSSHNIIDLKQFWNETNEIK